MAIQPIRLFGDPILRKPAVEVIDFDKELRKLVEDLTDTMIDAPGAGLAAPQIGVGLRVFTWFVEGEPGHLVNPTLELSEEIQDGLEGCLSLPELTFECKRAMSVVAQGFNMYGDPVTVEGSEMAGPGDPARDRPPRRRDVHRPPRHRVPQGSHEGDPRVRMVRHRSPGVQGLATPHQRARPLMRVVFAGTPEVALPALDAIADSGHDLVGVVTRPDAPSGRGRRLVASPIAQRAEDLGVPVLRPAHPRDPAFQAELKALEPDCCPVVAYGAILPQSALDIPQHGWVNLHFSCLPAWRGAAPVQHAIWAGDEVTGATTFRIVKELDAGPAYGVMTERIRPTDTAGDLLARLAEGGAGLLVATLDGIAEGGLEARAQQAEGVSFAPKILVEDARIDWTEPAVAVDRRIRACTPEPGAWTMLDGLRIKIGPVTIEPGDASTRAARGHQERCAGRDRDRPCAARCGHASRTQADERRRLGTRRHLRTRRPVRRLTWADPPRPTTSKRSARPCRRSSWGSRGETGRRTRCPRARRARGSCSTGCRTRRRSTPRPARCTTTSS